MCISLGPPRHQWSPKPGIRYLKFFLLCLTIVLNSPATAATPEDYLINVGDELELDILDDNDPPLRFIVGRNGAVQLPLIGSFVVASKPVGVARRQIMKEYIERQIFVDPSIELSIAAFRPVSVLGDVRNPGNYEYQPFMTAEQGVGLAGGPSIAANNEEARVLERRNLEGTLNSHEFDLALAAAQYARVQAQLNDRDVASWTDLPVDVRPEINREFFDEHKIKEDQIIALSAEDVSKRRTLLTDAAGEARNRIAILEEREVVLQKILSVSGDELTRVRDMAERGLITSSSVSQSELRVAEAESDLLRLKEQRSEARGRLAEVEAELSQFDSDRKKSLLNDSQLFWSQIKKLKSSRQSIEDRILLLDQWMSAASGLDTEFLLEYHARRRENGNFVNVFLKPYDELLPGDLLVVVVKSPETLEPAE